MSTRKVVFAALIAALSAAASSVYAMPAAPTHACVFDRYAALAVEPYRAEENYGLGTYSGLRGAQLFVEAREGLTAQWLTLQVQRALAAGPTLQCRPSVQAVRVQVAPAGTGFWVQLIGADEASGASLLRWAQSVVTARGK